MGLHLRAFGGQHLAHHTVARRGQRVLHLHRFHDRHFLPGLDPVAVDVMSEVLREKAASGVPVIFSSHQLDLVQRLCDRVGIIRGGKILMVDQKDAMMARLGRTEAHVMLAQPLDALPPAIASFPVELEEGGRSICYRGGDGTGKGREEVADLTKALIASGIDYVGIDVRESSLEDIFVSLLGEEEEQAA